MAFSMLKVPTDLVRWYRKRAQLTGKEVELEMVKVLRDYQVNMDLMDEYMDEKEDEYIVQNR